MRLSDLMGTPLADADGNSLGEIKDVLLVESDGGWEIASVLVGRGSFAERLGFLHGRVERPALLARLMRRLERHARMVPWDLVSLRGDGGSVAAPKQSLRRPGE